MKTQEEIIKIIFAYEQELDDNYKENRELFGMLDEATNRAFSKWYVIDELMERLNLKNNYEKLY